MNVQDVMTRDVAVVAPETPLREVAHVLAARGVSGVPVVVDGKVLGVVTERDILYKETGGAEGRRGVFALPRHAALERKLEARTAVEAMTAPAATIAPDRPVALAATLMIEQGVNRLPVVDPDGRLVGIVTRADLVRAFMRTDAEIERELREEVLLRMLWLAPERVDVEVAEGEVTLSGEVETKALAELVASVAARVPGVVGVRSRLTWTADEPRLLALPRK